MPQACVWQVQGIRRSVAFVLDVMGVSLPALPRGSAPAGIQPFSAGLSTGSIQGPDIACLIYFMQQMLEEKGSIEGFFLKGYSPDDENIKAALTAFSRNALSLDSSPIYGKDLLPEKAGVRFFFLTPWTGARARGLTCI